MLEHSIAIVGGGLSGSLVVIQCLDLLAGRAPEESPTLHWIEPRTELGRGIAYSTENPAHILNVPAAKMGLGPDSPSHFFEWANARDPSVEPGSFLPRKLYGEYIGEKIEERIVAGPQGVVIRHECEASDLEEKENRFTLSLSDGSVIECDQVVLALGNSRSGEVPIQTPAFYESSRYIKDPRDEAELHRRVEGLPAGARILILGSGLTMMDTVLTLDSWGRKFEITALSRRGLLSHVHAASPILPAWNPTNGGTLLETLRQVRKHARAKGAEWRSVIDAMRTELPLIWAALDLSDRKQFVRHVQAFWDIHRHRVAPEVYEKIQSLTRSGAFELLAGKLVDLREEDGKVATTFRKRGEESVTLTSFDLVVNCTGPEANLKKARSPLLKNLLDRGLVRTDELGLGLEANTSGALYDRRNQLSAKLFSLGPPLKGTLWETTAAPEIRAQAKRLAKLLVGTRS